MHAADYAIIAVYLVGILGVGVWRTRRAAANPDEYFLGGQRLPWWALGASGMSSNLDIAGTMTLVAMVALYGLHGLWIEMRGGVVLPIAVFLAFMGKWHRRSRVMTTAEWMLVRFGDGRQGRAARFAAALTYVVITVAMIVFFFSAGGRFLAAFLPLTETQCAVVMALVAFGYTLAGGLYGVVWTDVVQALVIGAAAIYIAITAHGVITPELLGAWPGSALNSFVPRAYDAALAPYETFWIFLGVWALKGVLEGLGGSAGSAYMAQRFYAAHNDADCRRIAMLWTVLFSLRWPMVLGFALLALHLGLEVRNGVEAEGVLPAVLGSHLFPPGARGLVLAAMLAAAMSTFDSTINAGASYLVRDVYAPLRPNASAHAQVRAGYAASALLVAVGLSLSLASRGSVIDLWVGIVMQLFPAFLVPFALRWFWSRFNGAGFTVGIATGFAAAVYFWLARPQGWNEAAQFLAIAGVSLVGSTAATFAADPVSPATLHAFYERVRPFGLWPNAWRTSHAQEHRTDAVLLAAALSWQVLTFLIPMGLMLSMWMPVAVASAAWLVLGTTLLRATVASP